MGTSSERTSILSSSPSSPSTFLSSCCTCVLSSSWSPHKGQMPWINSSVILKLPHSSLLSPRLGWQMLSNQEHSPSSPPPTTPSAEFPKTPSTPSLLILMLSLTSSSTTWCQELSTPRISRTTCRPTPWPERRSDSTHTHITTS